MSPFFKYYCRIPETDVLFCEKSIEVLVDTDTYSFWTGNDTENRRFAVPHVNRIGQHVKNRKIMLNDYDGTLRGKVTD